MKFLYLWMLAFMFTTLHAQKAPLSYKIFDAQGKQVSYKKMIKHLNKQDVVFFGELHNSAIAHWLEYEVATSLAEKKPLIMGMEMFETDNQSELNSYFNDSIDFKVFQDSARLWPNFNTDYLQLLEMAKNNHLPLIATNIPRRYAKQVHYGGFDNLNEVSLQAKEWIAPLPVPFDITLPTYQKIMTMMGGHHGSENLVKAQAIKDATMAYFISKNFQEGNTFLHFNGSFHTDYHEGIIWYLKHYAPLLTHGSISTVVQTDIYTLEEEHYNKADFIICIDANVTTSY